MKTTFNFLFAMAFVFIFGFTYNTFAEEQECFKIDIGYTTLTSTEFDIGSIGACFDDETQTIARSANINPAYIQVEFVNTVNVDSANVFVGQIGGENYDRNVWWLEAADNLNDLTTKSGSYILAVDSGYKVSGFWHGVKFSSSISKKIWRFNIKRVLGDNYVHIGELGLYTYDIPIITDNRIDILTEMRANNIVINNNANDAAHSLFDKDFGSGINIGSLGIFNFLFSMKRQLDIVKMKVHFTGQCSWYLEYADTYEDLENQINTYGRVNDRQNTSNKWDSITFVIPLNKKHLRLKTFGHSSNLRINEIEFFSEEPPANLLGLQENLELWEGWLWRNVQPNLLYKGRSKVKKELCQWTSSNPLVASVDENGTIKALKAGTAIITASYNSEQCTTNVVVLASGKEMEKSIPSQFIGTPAANCIFEVPIVIVQYIPSLDGINKKTAYAPEYTDIIDRPISEIKRRGKETVERLKFAFEEGSRFRKYKVPNAVPSIGLKVVEYIIIYEPYPAGVVNFMYDEGIHKYAIDYERMFEQINFQDLVENHGVRYLWVLGNGGNAFWPSYNPDYVKPEYFRAAFESYMATPTDIVACNGGNPVALPVFNKTYTVINSAMDKQDFNMLNFECFTHQFEALFVTQNIIQDGNKDLFWNDFVGEIGRCGWTHTPPNTKINYGYMQYVQTDPNLVQPTWADIEDWKPDNSGEKKLISYHAWTDIQYNWPDGVDDFIGREELQWFIYWLQSIPGHNNHIPYKLNNKDYEMTNWWRFIYDWDYYALNETGLYAPLPEAKIEIGNFNIFYCSGSEMAIEFEAQGNFNSNNTFTAILSDKFGSFSDAIEIGSLKSNVSGTIIATIPKNTSSGDAYKIRIVASEPNINSIDNGKTLSIIKTPAVEITGENSFCQKNIQTFSRINEEGYIYLWIVEGGQILGCNNCVDVRILWDKTETGVVKLYATNMELCIDSVKKNITLYELPDVEIQGPTDVCENNIYEYEVNNFENTSYTLNIEGGEIIGNSNNQKVQIKWGNHGIGKIKLKVTNLYNCIDSSEINIYIYSLPKPAIFGDEHLCVGEYYEFYANSTTAHSYFWSAENGIINGSVEADGIFIKWNEPGEYKIALKEIVNNTSCVDSTEKIVVVQAKPDKPTIERNGNKLVSSALTGNQWFLDNYKLIDSVNREIYPSIDGLYSVKQTVGICESLMSEQFGFVKTGIKELDDLQSVLLIYNPDNMSIIIKNPEYSNIEIYDTMGKLVLKFDNITINKAIDISTLSKGVFFVKYGNKIAKFIVL